MTRSSPASRAAVASSIVARIACAGSGAGMIPSAPANSSAAADVSFCREARGGDRRFLPVGARLDQALLDERAERRCVAVVAQPAGMDGRRHEVVAERE